MSEEGLIFLGGCMRSGTTILHRVLCSARESHPYISECRYLFDQLQLYALSRPGFDTVHKDFFGTPENLERFTKNILRNYFLMTRARYAPAPVLILKHPEATPYFPLLGRWFDTARFVVSVRDPRDTIVSIMDVGQRHKASGLKTPMAGMGRDMRRLSEFFKDRYASVLKAREKIGAGIVFVRYEELMTNTESIVGRLGEACGLHFDMDEIRQLGNRREQSAFLDRETRTKDDFSGAFWSDLYTDNLSGSRIGRYREALSPEEIAEIEAHCADFNKVFPYW